MRGKIQKILLRTLTKYLWKAISLRSLCSSKLWGFTVVSVWICFMTCWHIVDRNVYSACMRCCVIKINDKMTVITYIITPDYFWYLANSKCPGQLQFSWREVWSRLARAEQTVQAKAAAWCRSLTLILQGCPGQLYQRIQCCSQCCMWSWDFHCGVYTSSWKMPLKSL